MAMGRIIFIPAFAIATASIALCASASSQAQSAPDQCIQQGHKPGTAGFYRCLQETQSDSGTESVLGSQNGDAESILRGNAQDAVSDYTGSSMDGATKPDPNILKNFDPGGRPGR